MDKSVINKLILSRCLYQLAKENIRSSSGVRLSIACNALQDAVECFLLALSDHVNAGIGQRTDFDKYFEQINLKIAPRELPFRLRLISLNKLRVNSKHYGLEPAKSELDPLFTTVWEFFNEVSRTNFGKEFTTISLLDVLADNEAKELLKQAEAAYEKEDYVECLIECRKAIYVKFERFYDAQPFLTNNKDSGLLAFASKVPYFARDRKYIEDNVKEPTDFVIYDHNAVDMDLMKSGVDSVTYWNVWRLTPKVYRKNKDSPWTIKYAFSKMDADGIKDRAEYVLVATTEILLTSDQNGSRARSPDPRRFYLTLKHDAVSVYKKASKHSIIAQITAPGIRKLYCDYSVDGLDGCGKFWHVSHWDDQIEIHGFIHESDVES